MNPPRILLLAEACNPQWVSVPLVAWSQYQALSRRAPVHLVTQVRNRPALLEAGLAEERDFTAIDTECVARRANKLAAMFKGGTGKGWTTLTAINALSYPYFERLIWRQFSQRLRSGDFDIVHRVTPLSPTMPSSMAAHCRRLGIPFVLGPLNGGVPWPRQFDAARRREKEWLSYVRDAYRFLPGYHATRRNASAILIASRDTWRQMPRAYRNKCCYLPENAIDPAKFTKRRDRRAARPLRVIFIGRLVPYKGADMLVEAAAPLIRNGDLALQIIGDGPQMPELRSLITRENLDPATILRGWVEHANVQDHLADSDLFAFPSIREFGGAVALEAMAAGVPPIVVNYGGPAELVTPDTGFLIEMGTRPQIICRLRECLSDLAAHPEQIDARSAAAARRAHGQFTWDIKAQRTLDIYRWVMNPTLPRPRGMDLPPLILGGDNGPR
jgi:glycosyltransferase involved in cell wall biosynthesis